MKLDDTEPLSTNFEMLSYATLYPTRNLGFNCIWYLVFPSSFVLCWILRRVFCKCKKVKKILRKFRDEFLSNGLVLFLNSSYLCTCVALFLSTSYTKFNTPGNTVNSCFSVVLGFVVIFYPVFVGAFYTYNFEKIVKEDKKFLDKWGSLIEPLNFKRRGK